MQPPEGSSIIAPPIVAIVDGSVGFRLAIAALVTEYFPDARIEDIDPYSQTMCGAGFTFGTRGDAVILGGVGTESEAFDALTRLRSRDNCPPIIMLVADNLASQRPTLLAAGAFDVLRKDALSGQRLRAALTRAIAPAQRVVDPTHHQSAPTTAPAIYDKFFLMDDNAPIAVDIDSYRCLSKLASGQLAHVFLAEHAVNQTRVAVKILTSLAVHNTREMSTFCNLARRLRPHRGTSVVREFDSGITATFPYTVMEYLSNGDLRQRMRKPIDVGTAIEIFGRLLHALGELHQSRICHADLKPESVFFRDDASIVLIDFNISTMFGSTVRCSETGDVLGTPIYMSPEQGAGQPVDARSDLYAVGVILHELLTGAPPFVGDTAAQIIFRHLHDEVPLLPMRLRQFQPILDKLLAKSPTERFATPNDVMRALARIAVPNAD